MVAGFVFVGCYIADGFVNTFGVVPVDSFGGGGLDVLPGRPGEVVDVGLLTFVQADGRLHQPVIVGITDCAGGAGQPLSSKQGLQALTGVLGPLHRSGG